MRVPTLCLMLSVSAIACANAPQSAASPTSPAHGAWSFEEDGAQMFLFIEPKGALMLARGNAASFGVPDEALKAGTVELSRRMRCVLERAQQIYRLQCDNGTLERVSPQALTYFRKEEQRRSGSYGEQEWLFTIDDAGLHMLAEDATSKKGAIFRRVPANTWTTMLQDFEKRTFSLEHPPRPSIKKR